MTSRENNNATEKFFEKNDFFGLPYEDVKFFKQGELLRLSLLWKIPFPSQLAGGNIDAADQQVVIYNPVEQLHGGICYDPG